MKTRLLASLLATLLASTAAAQTPPTSTYGLDFAPNNALPVSAANRLRLRYSSASGQLQLSNSTAAYVEVINAGGSYANPTWLTSLAASKLTGTLALPLALPFAPSSSTPLGNLRWEPGSPSGTWTSPGDFFRVNPETTGSTPWNMGMVATANVGNPNPNNILTFGWNCGTQGQITSANGSFCNTTESEFGPTGGRLMEHYLNYVAPNAAATYRLLTFNMSLDAPFDVNVGLVGSSVGLGVGTEIGEATRVIANSTATALNAPGNAGNVTLNASGTTATFSSAANLSSLSLTSGALALRAIAGSLGGADLTNRLTWDATNARLLSANGTNYFQSNNTDSRIVVGGTTNLTALGSDLQLNSSDLVTVQHGGTRAFQLGSNAEPFFIYGDNNTVGLALSSGAGGILVHGVERVTVANGAGIIFRTNNVNRGRFDYTSFKPDTDGTFNLGAASARWSTVYAGTATALPTCDGTTRGGMRTVFSGAGVPDTFQVCMKTGADTFGWQTVFTAP